MSPCDRVELQVASITSFLPNSDNNKEEYAGTARGPGSPSRLTPLQEAEFRRKQVSAQVKDAEKRNVVFDADPSPDSEITSEAIDLEVPLGVMDADGKIVTNSMGMITSERIIDAGHTEKCVMDVGDLVGSFPLDGGQPT